MLSVAEEAKRKGVIRDFVDILRELEEKKRKKQNPKSREKKEKSAEVDGNQNSNGHISDKEHEAKNGENSAKLEIECEKSLHLNYEAEATLLKRYRP